jgi:hypothetical protein
MIPHPYIYEKMYASRHAEIQKEMQQTSSAGRSKTDIRTTYSLYPR